MAIVLNELLDGRSSNDASSTARRSFQVYDDAGGTVTETLARQQVTANGLTAGHAHPFITGLVGRAPSYQQNGRIVDVTIDYVVPELNNPQPPVDPTSPNFESMSTSFRIEEISLPTFVTKRLFVTDDVGNTAFDAFIWTQAPELPPVQKQVFTFTYRLSGSFTALDLPGWLNTASAVRQQANKLHIFNGTPYLFSPRIINQERASTASLDGRFRIEYDWTFDPGILNDLTRWVQSAGDNPQLRGDGARFYPVFDDTYILPPWYGLTTAAVPDDPTASPVTVFYERFLREPNGWQTLPGVS